MNKIYAIAILSAITACRMEPAGPSNLNSEGKFLHPIKLTSTPCLNSKVELTAEWAIYESPTNDWTATFRNGSQVVATVRDFRSAKSSGCVYSVGNTAVVLITPNGILSQRQANDSTSTVIK